MSTPAAIAMALDAIFGLTWFFALTRNGQHAARIIIRALRRPRGRHRAAHALELAQMLAWLRQLEDCALGDVATTETLRSPAAAWEPEEVPALEPLQGRAPLPPGGRLHPYRDGTPTRAERYSLRVPSYHSDPAEAVGAATGDFPRLIP